jgi:hypothetical protein
MWAMVCSEPFMSTTLPPGAIVLTRARSEPLLFAAVVDLVSRHRPFADYPFGVLVARLKRQLQQGAAVVALQDKRAVAYFGGVQVQEHEAQTWWEGRGATLPQPDWDNGTAIVVTIVVSDLPKLLRPMARSFASFYPNHRGYWKRTYSDGKPDSWRIPYGSRRRT